MKKLSLDSKALSQPKPTEKKHSLLLSQALRWWLLAATIALFALCLRVWTISQSLPYVDHPDEPNPIEYVVGMLKTGDPNQHYFQKPSFFVYLLLAAISLHYRLGLASGTYTDIQQMLVTTHLVTTVPGFFLVARWVSATFGALTVLSAFSLGARGWSRSAGIVGALVVALLPYHLRFSQWATTDITASFLASLSLGAAILAVSERRFGPYIVAGAFAGLAASAKYNAGAVVGAIVAAALVSCFQESHQQANNTSQSAIRTLAQLDFYKRLLRFYLPRLCAAAFASIVCFIAGTPYALINWSLVGGGIARQWTNYGGANGHYRGEWNIAGYRDFFLYEGLSPLLCLAVLVGLGFMAWRRWPVLAVWLGFALPTLLVHLSRPTHFMQNMLPLLVACSLPIGVCVVEIARLSMRFGSIWRWATLGILLLALLAPAASDSFAYVGRQAAGDSRLQLFAWMETAIAPGARIAAEIKPVPSDTEQRWTDVQDLSVHDIAWYREQGYAYLFASSKRWNQFAPPASYAELLDNPIIAEFGPLQREDMLGPRILVIDTELSGDDATIHPAGKLLFGRLELAGVSIGDPSAEGEPPMLNMTQEFKAGGVLGIRTFWQVEQAPSEDLYIFVHVIDAQGNKPTQRDAPPWQGRFPTSTWKNGTLVVDVNDVYLPPTMPPGEYRVVIGMFNPLNDARPQLTQAGVVIPSGEFEITTIRIVP